MRLALIPARGGSKRISRKNIRLFAGQPIIAHSIATARRSGLFDAVVVSTDDEEIAGISRAAGAEVPFLRPAEFSGDGVAVAAVMKHALRWLARHGRTYETCCLLYATAPFLTATALREGLDRLEASGSSFALSVTSFDAPIQRALRVRKDGTLDPFWPDNAFTRSQDLEPAYHDAAQFCWGRSAAFLADAEVFSPATTAVVLSRHRVQDIDTPEDWLRAEIAYEVLRRSGKLGEG